MPKLLATATRFPSALTRSALDSPLVGGILVECERHGVPVKAIREALRVRLDVDDPCIGGTEDVVGTMDAALPAPPPHPHVDELAAPSSRLQLKTWDEAGMRLPSRGEAASRPRQTPRLRPFSSSALREKLGSPDG